ncbi:unnamed protein product [Knipowitschia caucasica]|uniref:Uncharacterized protein n=1 Tax=Knipowitschia caucasica TaxID=637954 RepID=A0AAV2LRB0_KNICA
MDGKKHGVLSHLKQKVHPLLPSLLRGKTQNKGRLQSGLAPDRRMSSSVPDIRHKYVPSTAHIHRQDVSSSSASQLSKAAPRQAGGGSGPRMGAGRSEQVLCAPTDCTDWNPTRSSESRHRHRHRHLRAAADMEPEELGLPEVMTIYTPEQSPGAAHQVSANPHETR